MNPIPWMSNSPTIRQFQTFEIIGVANFLIYEVFYTSYLILCICYSYDLYLTIKNPLYPAKKRLRWYFVWVAISIIILLTIEGIYYKSNTSHMKDLEGDMHISGDKVLQLAAFQSSSQWKIILLIPLFFFVVVGTYSCIKAYRSLKQPGLG